MILSVYTDGGSRGNPGHSGYGVVFQDEQGQAVHTISQYIGIKTNNEAEYSALIDALTWLNDHQNEFDIQRINFYADSQLLVRQVQGIYKVKAPNIVPLHRTVMSLLSTLKFPYTFTDVRRESNQLADDLANQAMDRKK
ncbi:ribonuclease HI family protein [Candidatus Shapirobacteria bacterium]|nr:ribonuclease HI family protein [Candidatus Shapirobacteria bacterium]